MLHRITQALTALFLLAAVPAVPAVAAEPLRVVATFSILGDIVRTVGGDHVRVTSLVGPDGDAHVYQPTPADGRALAEADLVVVNGLGFEGWIDRLVAASGYRGPLVVASDGVDAIEGDDDADHAHGKPDGDGHAHSHGHSHAHAHDDDAPDPHAWQDLANGRRYLANVARALAAADPSNADDFARRAAAYDGEMAALDREIRARVERVPADRRTVITSHDAFRYFGRAYGIDFIAPVGISTESEPSAGEFAKLIRQVRDQGVRVVFVENITDPRLVEQLAREAGATVGGTLYSDSLSGPDGPAATYLDMFRHNAATIAGAFGS